MSKILYVAAAAGTLVMLPLAAGAAPTLSVTATDNGVALPFVVGVSTPGTLTGSFTDANFSQIAVDITGVPSVPSPDLGTVTLQVSGSTGGGHTINLIATQSGLSQPAGFNGALTQTFNNLIGDGGPAVESFLVNGTTINTHTFLAGVPRVDTATFSDTTLPAITSDAQQFVVSFTAAGQDVELTQEFQAAVVSEPGSLALLGAGLVGTFAFARRRQSRR